MNWTDLKKNIYYLDGSLRDIYVLNTDLQDNEKWCEFVSENYMVQWFNGIKQINETKIDFEVVKGYLDGTHDFCSSVSIYFDKIQINNHFFINNEIENDISPKEIDNIETHEKVIKYLKAISLLLDKPIILTPEDEQETILIRVTKNKVEYLPKIKKNEPQT